MIVINLKRYRKPALAALLLFAAFAAVYIIYCNGKGAGFRAEVQNSEAAEAFLTAICSFDRQAPEIEIFDVGKGAVVKKLKMDDVIRSEIEDVLANITGMYVKVKAFPEKGNIARVPLEPALKVENEWPLKYGISSVNEAFIVFPEDADPYLLLLDSSYRPLFFNFKQSGGQKLKSYLLERECEPVPPEYVSPCPSGLCEYMYPKPFQFACSFVSVML